MEIAWLVEQLASMPIAPTWTFLNKYHPIGGVEKKGRKKQNKKTYLVAQHIKKNKKIKKKKNHGTSSNLYWSYYPYRSRELVSPVCRIFLNTHYMWPVTCDIWHMGGGRASKSLQTCRCTSAQNFQEPAQNVYIWTKNKKNRHLKFVCIIWQNS